ncbi:hypothetical protein [Nocardioides sp.]|jgi:ABC-type sugar transport system permease subunit|uniref:hypothetical protein n=1 Tax=Nocardioides sp. TaxID=35761 RepID=UPI0031FE900B|nr:hypothetical protein [Nocardioides sp.]
MSELTATESGRHTSLRQHPWLPVAVQVVVIVVLFAIAGAFCGWLWQHLWTPPKGVVANHTWYTDEKGLRSDFSGTALYVLIAVPAGLLIGAVTAFLFDRAELATLLAVVVGAVLAAWLMWQVGVHSNPVDPHEAATTAKDGTKLVGDLHVTGKAPFVAFPVGALSALIVVFLGLAKRHRR